MRENAPNWKLVDGDALARFQKLVARGQTGLFCAQCGAPGATTVRGRPRGEAFACPEGHYETRCLRWDEALRATLDDDGLVHDIAVLVCTDPDGRTLLVRRAEFPWGWSLPRRHLRPGDEGPPFPDAEPAGVHEGPGRSRWGSDRQRWHLWRATSAAPEPPESLWGEEADRASWQTKTRIEGLRAAGLLLEPFALL